MGSLRDTDRFTDFLDLFWKLAHAERLEKYLWREDLLLGKATRFSCVDIFCFLGIFFYVFFQGFDGTDIIYA